MDNSQIQGQNPPPLVPSAESPSSVPATTQISNKKKFAVSAVLLSIILLVAAGTYYVDMLRRNTTPIAPKKIVTSPTVIVSPTSIPDPYASWQEYHNNVPAFSLKYPHDWDMEEASSEGSLLKGVRVQGEEGSVHISWGSGFGGLCAPKDKITLELSGESIEGCHSITPTGIESFGQIYTTLGTTSLSINAIANKPYMQTRESILKVISTITFEKEAVSSPSASIPVSPTTSN